MGLLDFLGDLPNWFGGGGGYQQPATPAPAPFIQQAQATAATPQMPAGPTQLSGPPPPIPTGTFGSTFDPSMWANVAAQPGGGGGGAAPGAPSTPWNKILAPVLGGAGGIMGLAQSFKNSGQEKALQESMRQQKGVSGPAIEAGQEQLKAGQTGTLTAAQQAAIDKYKQEQLAYWRQYLASAGIPESSAMHDIVAKIDQDALAMSQQMLQQDFDNGLKSLGLGENTLANTAQQALLNELEISKAHQGGSEALQQLAAILGNLP